jgi:hypothetical protein
MQGFGSGSGSTWIRINLSCGSRRAKMTHKNKKKSRIFMFLSTGCSLLRAEGFSCSLGVFYGGRGISKLQFWIKKIEIKFPIFFNFRSSNPGSAVRKNAGSGSKSMRIRNPGRMDKKDRSQKAQGKDNFRRYFNVFVLT